MEHLFSQTSAPNLKNEKQQEHHNECSLGKINFRKDIALLERFELSSELKILVLLKL